MRLRAFVWNHSTDSFYWTSFLHRSCTPFEAHSDRLELSLPVWGRRMLCFGWHLGWPPSKFSLETIPSWFSYVGPAA
jgi:hypothetical protein